MNRIGNPDAAMRNRVLRDLATAPRPKTIKEIAKSTGCRVESVAGVMKRYRMYFQDDATTRRRSTTSTKFRITPMGTTAYETLERKQFKFPAAKTKKRYRPVQHPLPWEDGLWLEIQESQRQDVGACLDQGITDISEISEATTLPVWTVERRVKEIIQQHVHEDS